MPVIVVGAAENINVFSLRATGGGKRRANCRIEIVSAVVTI